MKMVSSVGEDELVSKLTNLLHVDERIIVPPGDDCAVVDVGHAVCYQLLKTDTVVEGIHYFPDTDPALIGRKAIARVLSDFAAMAGKPDQLLASIALAPEVKVSQIEKCYEGMEKCAHQFGATICGGETSSLPKGSPMVLTISGTGWVDKQKYVTRSGGASGDWIMVTGKLGGSLRSKHLEFQPRLEQAQWLAEHCLPTAMMDLSDGLASDLPRLADASGCNYDLNYDAIPCSDGSDLKMALGDGEDYELLFTISPTAGEKLLVSWQKKFPDLKLTKIGELREGKAASMDVSGWRHW